MSYPDHPWRSRGQSFLLLAAMAALFILPQAAVAHSPSDMKVLYDPASQQLSVTIMHQVPDPASHYVKEVIINVNGQAAITTPYTSQPSPSLFTYTYPLRAGTGDTVEVYAQCVLGGSITRSITVAGDLAGAPVPKTPFPSATKSSPAIVLVPALLVIVLAIRNRNHT